MKLNIDFVNGDTFSVETDAEASIQDFKAEIAYTQSLVIDQIKLMLDGRVLTEGTVGGNGLRNGQTVHMVVGEVVNIRISVDLPDGSRQSMDIEPSEEIAIFKQKLQAKFGYRVEEIELIFEGNPIEGGRLSHYRISNGSTLSLRLKMLRVTIADMNGKKFDLELEPTMSIDGLKERLHTETRVLAAQQRLLYMGRELNSGTLSSNGIGAGSTINMRGAACTPNTSRPVINMVGRTRGG